MTMTLARLRKIELQGFRSFGSAKQTINLPDSVAALWGNNSQGKTSLAEAIEFLLTGQTSRRELLGSSKEEFSDSLRNAHVAANQGVIVEAEILCPNGKTHHLRRTLTEDYSRSGTGCTSKIEIDGKVCADGDIEKQLGLRLLQPPLRAPVLTQHTLGYVFSTSPTERANFFRSVLDIQDLEDFRNAVASLAPQLSVPIQAELDSLVAVESIPALTKIAARARSSASQADADKYLLDCLSTLLSEAAVKPEGDLSRQAAQLEQELHRRQAQTFPMSLFSRRAFSSWKSNAETIKIVVDAFLGERAKIDAETRRLTELFRAALALPSLEHDETQDCPLCGAENKLTTERIKAIREQLKNTEAYQVAEKEFIETLQAADSGLQTLEQTLTQSLPKFGQIPASDRRAQGFTISKIETLLPDKPIIAVWTAATSHLRRSARALEGSVSNLREAIATARETLETWADNAALYQWLGRVDAAQSAFGQALQAYAERAKALTEPLKETVDENTQTTGWDALIKLARDSKPLLTAILASSAHAQRIQELVKAVREIDNANGKVADDKFSDLSDAVRTWWDLLRPDETSFFEAVQRRSAKARRTIDLKVGLSAKDDGSDPKLRDAIAVFSQSQLHCLGLSLFLARAVQEKTGFIVLDDPVLTSDDDYRPNFSSAVIEALLKESVQVVVITQDNKSWKDIGQRWAHKGVAQYQMIRSDAVIGTEIRNQNDDLATMLARAQPFIKSPDPEQRKQGATKMREAIERFGKEIIVRHRRANGDGIASITDYDGQNFGNFATQVQGLLTKDASHPGKLTAAHSYVTPGPHDDKPPSKGELVQAYGDLKFLKKEYLD